MPKLDIWQLFSDLKRKKKTSVNLLENIILKTKCTNFIFWEQLSVRNYIYFTYTQVCLIIVKRIINQIRGLLLQLLTDILHANWFKNTYSNFVKWNMLPHTCRNQSSRKSHQTWYLPFSAAIYPYGQFEWNSPPENIHRGQLCTVPWAVNEAPTGESRFPSAKLTLHGHSVHRYVQPLKLSPKKCYDSCTVSPVWAHGAWLFQTLIDTTFLKKRDKHVQKKDTMNLT